MKSNPLQPFLTDVLALRRDARTHAEHGAVTASYTGGSEQVVAMLNGALATEIVCMLRYRRHHAMVRGLAVSGVAAELLVHANEELAHADRLAARIVELNGAPDFNPASLTARSHAEYIEGDTLVDMLREDLVSERIAIDAYRGAIAWLGEGDPTTRRLLESILEVEEGHATELADLLVVHTPNNVGTAVYPPELAPLPNGFRSM